MKFTSRVTNETYFIKGDLSCNSQNVIYLTTCDKCKYEPIASAVDFKTHFGEQKSDIKIKQKRTVVVLLDILLKKV